MAKAAAVAAVAALAVGLGLAAAGAGSSGAGETISSLSYLLLLGIATGAALSRAMLRQEERSAWLAIAIGLALWFAGDVVFFFFETAPTVIEDTAYFGFYAFSALGMGRLAQLSGWRPRYLLDTGVGLAGVTCLWAAFVVEHVIDADPELALKLAYPVADLALAVLAIGVLQGLGWRSSPRWLLIAGGLVAIALVDSVYVVQAAQGQYVPGTALDFVWPAAALAVGGAAWLRAGTRRTMQPEHFSVLVSGIAVVGAVVVLVTDHFSSVSLLALCLAMVTVALGLVRAATLHVERLAAERSLRIVAMRSAQVLGRLAEAQKLSHIGSWEWDVTTNAVSWSDELHRIFGVSREEFEDSYEAFLTLVHPDDRERVKATTANAHASGNSYRHEYRIVRPDGDVRFCDARGKVRVGDRGETEHVFGTVQDVTERTRVELELRDSRELLQAVLDGSPSLIFTKDPSFRYMLTNKRYEESFGLDAGEMIGRTDEHLLDPAKVEEVRDVDRRVLKGEPMQIEHELPVQGGRRTFLTQKYPLRDEHGEVYAVCGLSTDITAQKEAQEELSRRADRQAAVSKLGGRALHGLRLADLFAEATLAVSQVLDVEFAKVLELQPDSRELLLRAAIGLPGGIVDVSTVPSNDGTQAGYTLTADGPVAVYDLAAETRFCGAALLQDHDVVSGLSVRIMGEHSPFGVIAAHTAHRRRFTDEEGNFLQAIANVLGWAIARHRSERLELQLQQSQRLESVGQLAGGIAHDFNNLLAVILNYASFAIDALDADTEVRADIQEIEKAAKRAADLTRQLLVFSRREPVIPEALNINAVVTETEKILRRTIGEHIELETGLAPGLSDVMIGAGQLEQILVNLAVNARDAMPDGGVLTISTSDVSLEGDVSQAGFVIPAGRYVRLIVSDTGTGMAKEVADHAFDPFFTTKSQGRGTGLGLATVYGAVKQAGGYINLYSEEGHGTVVKVYLPVTIEERRDAPDARGQDEPQGGSETVMLVEDEGGVRRLTERILADHGYRVLSASDGEAAIELCRERAGDIDLLLTDVVMPRMSGKELATQIGKLQPELAVLYMSGYTNDVIARRGVLEEGVLLLEKPFDATELLAKIRAALGQA